MKSKSFILSALAISLSTSAFLIAQDAGGPPRSGNRPPREGRGPGGPGEDGQRPPPPPLFTALDINDDGVIDASEIAKSPESLKKLDKNQDGKLTPDETRPPRSGGPGGPGGPGGRDGQDLQGPRGERRGPGEPGGEGRPKRPQVVE